MRKELCITVILMLLASMVNVFLFFPEKGHEGSEIFKHKGRRSFSGRTRGDIIVNDDGGGNYTTIQDAVDNASVGDTIFVWAGTYNETVCVNKTVTIIGNGTGKLETFGDTSQDGTSSTSWKCNAYNVSKDIVMTDFEVYFSITGGRTVTFMVYEGATLTGTYTRIHESSRDFPPSSAGFKGFGPLNVSLQAGKHYITAFTFNGTATYYYDGTPDLRNCSFGKFEGGQSISSSLGVNESFNPGTNLGYHERIRAMFEGAPLIDKNGGSGDGIYIASNWVNVSGFKITNCGDDGIDIRSDNCRIERNYCYSNADSGIYSYGSDYCKISNNTCNSNNDKGMELVTNFDNNEIKDNVCEGNTKSGLYLTSADSNTISNNFCSLNGDEGIYFSSSDYNTITGNNCSSNDDHGLHFFSSDSNKISKNRCRSNVDYGIYMNAADVNNVEDNHCDLNGDDGMRFYNADSCTVSDNYYDSNEDDGIYFSNARSNHLLRNKMVKDGLTISGVSLQYFNTHTISTNNTVNDKPLYYLKNATNGTVSVGAGQVILANCTNVIVEYQNISNVSMGIRLAYSNNNEIRESISLNNTEYGIYLEHSDGNYLHNNTLNKNKYGLYVKDECRNNTIYKNQVDENSYGIYLYGNSEECKNNTLDSNTCNKNDYSGIDIYKKCYGNKIINNSNKENYYGIRLRDDCKYNVVEKNVLKENNYGIYVYASNDESKYNNLEKNICSYNKNEGIRLYRKSNWNNVTNNTLLMNSDYGIRIYNSEPNNNSIHHNTLIENNGGGVQADDDGANNVWDDGSSKGNYWSDYTSRYSGASNDGNVWNTSYAIDGNANNHDRYPTVNAFNDNQSPTLDSDNSQGNGTTGDPYSFNVSASDDLDVRSVSINWTHGDLGGSISLNESGSYWLGTVTLDQSQNNINYFIYIYDHGNNKYTSSMGNYTVSDNDPPIADAGANQTIGQGSSVTFNGSASTDNIQVTNYTWEFSDNGNQTVFGASPSYTFNNAGTITITLTVYDGAGYFDTDTMTVGVNDTTNPVADAGTNQTIAQGTNLMLNGSASTDNVGVDNYTWSFTDAGSQILYGVSPWYTFNNAGAVVVTLQVTDAAGNSDTDTVTITVTDITAPIADAGTNQTLNQGGNVTFDGSGSSDNVAVVNYTWRFYDGGNQTLWGVNAEYTFNNAGTFVVTMEAKDAAGNSGNDTMTVTVSDNTNPVADAGQDRTLNQGSNITFDGSGSTDNVVVVNYTWTFNDNGNQTLYGVNAEYVFNIAGTFVVTLKVLDTAGNSDTDAMTVTVNDNQAPSLVTDNSPNSGTTGDTFEFNISATDNVDVQSVHINWAHGGAGQNQSLNQTGNFWTGRITLDNNLNNMTYTIYIQDTSNNSMTSSSQNVTVTDNDAPTLTDDSPNTGTTGDSYTFRVTPTDNIAITTVAVSWSHGNNSGDRQLTDDGNGTWSLEVTLDDDLNNMTYEIWANDSSGNSVSTNIQSVSVTDNDDPNLLTNYCRNDGTTGDTFVFNLSVTDNIKIGSVFVNWAHGGSSGNLSLANMNGSIWSGSIVLDHSLGNLGYTIYIYDTSNNHNISSQQTVRVTDNDAPILEDDHSPNNGTTGDRYQFSINATDNINISSIHVDWTHGNLSGNLSLADAGLSWNGIITLDHDVGFMSYFIYIEDSSSNFNISDRNTIQVIDNDRPEHGAVWNSDLTTGDESTFFINISDNIGIMTVMFNYSINKGTPENISVLDNANGTWSIDLTLPGYSVSIEFYFWFEDTSKNVNKSGNRTLSVIDDDVPVANAGPDFTIDQGVMVIFNGINSTDNVGIMNYTWTFNECGLYVLHGEIQSHRFLNAGTYVVTLVVSDAAGQNHTDDLTVIVNDITTPIAIAGENLTVDQGTTVTFNASRSSDNVGIVNYTWTFTDDGIRTLYSVEPTYTFDKAGVFVVSLNITDAAGYYHTDTVTIIVNDTANPIANTGPDQTVDQRDMVTFNGSLSSDNVGIINYTWMFKDNGVHILYGPAPSFRFENAGTFNITLSVADKAGNRHSDNMTVTVLDTVPPMADAGKDLQVKSGDPVHFLGNATDNVGVVNHTWTFTYDGGAIVLYGSKVNFTFDVSGRYNITFTVTDAAGNTANDTISVTVLEGTPPRDKVENLALGPFEWKNGVPIENAKLILDTGTRSTYTAITDEKGVATFTEPVDFGKYLWSLIKIGDGKSVSILNGTLEIGSDTPDGETWWPEGGEDELGSPDTEEEFNERYDIDVIQPEKPPKKTEQTLIEKIPEEVFVGDEEITVTVTAADENTATLDIEEAKNVELKKGESQNVDSDGDGKDDLKVTYKGEDEYGNPIVEFEDMEVSSDKRSSAEETGYGTIMIIVVAAVVLILVLVLLITKRRKTPAEPSGDEDEEEEESDEGADPEEMELAEAEKEMEEWSEKEKEKEAEAEAGKKGDLFDEEEEDVQTGPVVDEEKDQVSSVDEGQGDDDDEIVKEFSEDVKEVDEEDDDIEPGDEEEKETGDVEDEIWSMGDDGEEDEDEISVPEPTKDMKDHLGDLDLVKAPPAIRNILPGFVITHKLGSGGFATVYRAMDKDGEPVAIKLPKFLDETLDSSILKKFQAEADIWMKLRHKNIVRFYSSDIRPIPYMSIELMEGGNLAGLLKKHSFPIEEAKSLMLQILDGISYAHRMASVHRDIKPENILFTKDGVPKISDWGIGKFMASESVSKSIGTKGTFAYAAPEQFSKKKFGEIDWSTDVFQLGIVFYEILTGVNPFLDDDPVMVMANITSEDPKPPSSLNPDIPKELDNIVMNCLEKAKEDRWRADVMLHELKQVEKRKQVNLKKYRASLERALADGEISTDEDAMLTELREHMSITDREHVSLLDEIWNN